MLCGKILSNQLLALQHCHLLASGSDKSEFPSMFALHFDLWSKLDYTGQAKLSLKVYALVG